jgi:ABC-2 type transport system permease protein
MKKAFLIWLANQRLRVQKRMSYPLNFFLLVMGSFLQIFVSVVFVELIYMNVRELSGWNRAQALMVMSVFNLIDGLLWATSGRLRGVSQDVSSGRLDSRLVMPMDAQILLSISGGDLEDWAKVLSSGAIFLYALSISGMPLADILLRMPLLVLLLVLSYLIYYSIFLVLRSFAFFMINQDMTWIFGPLIERISSYPIDIYGKYLRLILTALVPLAFLATVPAKIFLYLDWRSLLCFVLACFLSLYLSRRFFQYSLRHYESASN